MQRSRGVGNELTDCREEVVFDSTNPDDSEASGKHARSDDTGDAPQAVGEVRSDDGEQTYYREE